MSPVLYCTQTHKHDVYKHMCTHVTVTHMYAHLLSIRALPCIHTHGTSACKVHQLQNPKTTTTTTTTTHMITLPFLGNGKAECSLDLVHRALPGDERKLGRNVDSHRAVERLVGVRS